MDQVSPVSSTTRRLLDRVSHGVIASVVFGAAALPAGAQESGGAVQLPPVSVEGQVPSDYKPERVQSPKMPQPLVETPKTITVIPQEVIEERGAVSLTEVLRTVPGISLGSGEGGIPSGDRAFIRGFDARGDTFVDGARDFGGYFRDPFNLEQVEVSKGPGSAFTGRGSTGGALNLVSKVPLAENLYGGTLTLGSDQTRRVTADVNQVLTGDMALRLNAMYHEADVADRDAIETERWGFAPSLTLGLNGPTRLTLSYLHLSTDGIPDYGHPFDPTTGRPADVRHKNFYGLLDRDDQDTSADIGTVELSHEFSEALTLRNQLRFGRTTNDYIVTKPEINVTGAAITPAGQVTRAVRNRDETNTAIINQTDLTSKFDTAGIGHTLVTGLELSREVNRNRPRTIPAAVNADRDEPDPGQPYNGIVTYTGVRNKGDVDTIAVYAFDTIALTEQWDLLAGLRYDRYDTEYTAGNNPTISRVDNLFNWQGGIVYKPLPNGSIYAAVGTSSNPSAEFMTLSDATDNTDPEETTSYEIGTKWELFNRQLLVTAAVFRTDKTNARINDPLGGEDQVLDGEQRVDGIELGMSGNITRQWAVFGGYTYLDSEIRKSATPADVGNEFAGIAPHTFSLWTTYDVLADLTLGFGATYTAERNANNANTLKLPDSWRFDAMAAYQLTENVDIRLNVLNLTDEFYYDATHNGQFALVAPGRTFLLSTSFKF